MGLFTGASLLIAGASTAMSLAQASSARGAAAAGARAQGQAILANFGAAQTEGTRQQGRVNEIATDKQQDRKRLSDREASTIKNIAAERGLSDSTSARLSFAEAYAEGLDSARIEDNREEDVKAIQSHKERGFIMAQASLDTVKRKHDAAQSSITSQALNSVFKFVGSGLQIGMTHHKGQRAIARTRNGRG